MSVVTKLLSVAAVSAAILSAPAMAGPIIIAGTDADDHGSVSLGVNQDGWKFMQLAVERITAAVTNTNTSFVCIGCNPGEAQTAFTSAFGLAAKPAGWTTTSLTAIADITNFFNGTGTVNVNNTGAIYMPSEQGDVGGGITAAQQAALSGAGINTFVSNGGGLFTQV